MWPAEFYEGVSGPLGKKKKISLSEINTNTILFLESSVAFIRYRTILVCTKCFPHVHLIYDPAVWFGIGFLHRKPFLMQPFPPHLQLGMHWACASPVAGEQPRVQCLAQGHFNIRTGGGGDRAVYPVTSRRHALPPEPATPCISILKVWNMTAH